VGHFLVHSHKLMVRFNELDLEGFHFLGPADLWGIRGVALRLKLPGPLGEFFAARGNGLPPKPEEQGTIEFTPAQT